jgi:hypothetical protein
MLKQIVTTSFGIVFVLIFGLLITLGIQGTEALEWKETKYEKWNCCSNSNVKPISNLEWHWTNYERWNCCPGFNPNVDFKPIPPQESISSNNIIQKIDINQACDHVQICLIDLHDLNSQINYGNK